MGEGGAGGGGGLAKKQFFKGEKRDGGGCPKHITKLDSRRHKMILFNETTCTEDTGGLGQDL